MQASTGNGTEENEGTGKMEMNFVTTAQLATVLNSLTDSIQELAAKPKSATLPTYLTREGAAEYLCMSTRKLDDLAKDGAIKRAKLGTGQGGQVLFRRCDLDSYVEEHLELDGEESRDHARRLS